MKRKLAALLAVLTLLPTIMACSKDDTDTAETTAAETNETTAAETEPELKSAVPDDLDLDGFTVTILSYSYGDDLLLPDEMLDSGDIVQSAMLDSRRKVSEDLNIVFDIIQTDGANLKPLVQSSVLSGSGEYGLAVGESYQLASFVPENYYHNLLDLEYANYTADWWAGDWMDEAAVGDDARFMAVGDITLSKIQWQSCIYYNKAVYGDYFGDPDELYTVVDEGGWVLDEFAEMSSGIYSDLNGNGEKDIDDRYASILHASNLTDHLAYDSGFRATKRDSDGIPYIDIVNDKNVNFIEKLYDLYYNNDGSFVVPNSQAAEANDVIVPQKFAANELLFALGWFNTSSRLRDMEGDFGVIPFPKYDEAQDDYIALVHDSAQAAVIPISVSDDDADKLSAVMEAMAFYGWRDVTPTYYEVALKVKYIRDSDDIALRIIDTIASGAATDFAYIYNYALNNAGLIMRQLMRDRNADIASVYESQRSATETMFGNLVGLFTEEK